MADYEYEHEEDYEPRVLWGRVAFYVVGLVVAFVAGACFGGDGVDSQELANARRQIVDLSSEKAELEQRLAAAQDDSGGQGRNRQGGGGDGQDDGGGDGQTEGQDSIPEEGETYVVQSGDTLAGIAEQFYGDASKWELIRDANNLTRNDTLMVGQELVIPPAD